MLPSSLGAAFMPLDPVLIEKAAIIERCVARAREEKAAAMDFHLDYTRQDAAILNVERACEAAIGMAMRLVTTSGLGAPTSRREAFELLSKANLLDPALAGRLGRMVGFRNIAVHAYKSLDPSIVADVIDVGLEDLLSFKTSLLRAPPPPST
jgi:uncharacterized protein YutE (UPF0331/DUF86 family)